MSCVHNKTNKGVKNLDRRKVHGTYKYTGHREYTCIDILLVSAAAFVRQIEQEESYAAKDSNQERLCFFFFLQVNFES